MAEALGDWRHLGSLLRDAEAALTAAMKAAGFRRTVKWEYVCDLQSPDGIVGWVGVPTTRRPDSVETTPVVGVRDPEVEGLVAELRGGKGRAASGRTFGQPLSNLLPGRAFRSYALVHHGSVDPEAIDQMVGDILELGSPFMRELADRGRLLHRVERDGLQHDVMYALPVLLLLRGEAKAARKRVEKVQRESRDLAAMARAEGREEYDYDRFAERFFAYVDGGSTS